MRNSNCERGYVLFTLAAAMIALCGFAGLVVDVGYGEFTRRQAQAAADAGAKAAGFEIKNGATDITAAAKQDTANNGFADGVQSVTVRVNRPPSTGNYTTNNNYAEVIVTKVISTSFMSVLGVPSMSISARAVGGAGGASGGCIYALDTTDQDALLASGSATVNANCGVIDESNNSKGLEVSGSACITGTTIQTVGNYNGNCFTPAPTTGTTSPGDPLAGHYTSPTPAGCTATNWHNNSNSLSPGTYCGGITISGNGNNVTAAAGTYILYGGGLSVSGGANLSGAGVTFFNMDNAGQYKPIVFSGGSSSVLSAPTSGPYEGLLFWQDPNLPSNFHNQQNTVSGGSATAFEGILYFPNTPLYYSGGSTQSSNYVVLVAWTLNFSGNSAFNGNYSSLESGAPIRNGVVLAE